MSGAEFLGGAAMFTAVGAAAAGASWRFLRRGAPGLDPFERAVAVALVGVVLVLAIHLVPLALGVLDRVTVLVTALLVAAAGLAVRPAADARPDPPRPPAATDGAPALALAGLTTFAVLVAAVADVRAWMAQVVQGLDTLTFHLPNAARWIQSGSMWQVDEFLPFQSHGSYPNHGELLFTWAMLPFDDDLLVRPLIVAILALWAFTIVAAARELGAPPAARALGACALVTIPIVADATVPRAMPDVLAYFGVTAGLLFLLRFARTERRSDLVLAGLGLGLAVGTKWYGAPGALVLLVVLAGCRRLAGAQWRAQVGDLAVLGGVVAATGGIWLVRNAVELGNPVFPKKVAPFGVTLFDGPRDLIAERAGFSIADYATDPDVLFGKLPGQIHAGVGWLALAALLLAAGCALVARRRRDRRAAALLAAAAALALVYALLPYSAFGARGDPALAYVSTRYLVPALIPLALAAAWAAGRTRAGIAIEVALAVAAVTALSPAFGPLRADPLATASVLVLAAGLALWAAARFVPARAHGAALVAVLAIATVGGLAYARRSGERVDRTGYAEFDPAFAAIEAAGPGVNVGLSGLWSDTGFPPIWPAFGPRIENEVRFVGVLRDGWMTPPRDAVEFARLIRARGDDLLIVGRGRSPRAHVREQDWARAAGLVPVTRSPRLLLYGSPALARRLVRQPPSPTGGSPSERRATAGAPASSDPGG